MGWTDLALVAAGCLPRDMVESTLAQGRKALAHLDLGLNFSWQYAVTTEGNIGLARTWAPAPDGEPHYTLLLFHPVRMGRLAPGCQRWVVLHELAHAADFAYNPTYLPSSEHHGPRWRYFMETMGANPDGPPSLVGGPWL